MSTFIAACVQLNSQDDVNANIAAAEALIRKAAEQKATFIALPENAFLMQEQGKKLQSQEAGVARCQALAKELKVWILIGSVHEGLASGKSYNRSLLIDPQGKIFARYDKIHLFDVTLKGGEIYSESARIEGGAEAVLAHTPLGNLGMTVCYDVRFPQLYRTLAQAGAELLAVPAAFTYTTGIAHWHALLQARAIENGCYVIAPAQCGIHPGKRKTYGHSLIIDTWGKILTEASESETGVITAIIDLSRVAEARGQIPSLKHDRGYGVTRY